MTKTYARYAFESWLQYDPERGLIADEILTPLFEGLDATRLHLDPAHVRTQRDGLLKQEDWPRERTDNLVSEVWAHIGGVSLRTAYNFEIARHPVKIIPDEQSPHMVSGGHCGLDGIHFRFDRSLSDPVYLVHESGHLMAHRSGSYAPRNLAEIQAFFAQEAAYDHLSKTMSDRGAAARTHRLSEFLSLQVSRDYGRTIQIKEHPGNDYEENDLHYLHKHVAAMPLAIYMYKITETMSVREYNHAIATLYHDKDPSFDKITQAFGLKNGSDFHVAGAYAGNLMRNEALALGIIAPAPSPRAMPTP